MRKQNNHISESQVEEALISNLEFLKKILQVDDNFKLLAKQLHLDNNRQRLDFLLAGKKDLFLIELKITKFIEANLSQILSYKNELIKLQNNNELILGNIRPFLLVTDATQIQIEFAKEKDITVIIYKPIEVMSEYFANLASYANFFQLKPNDYGVYNIGLIHRVLKEIGNGIITKKELQKNILLSSSSIKNHLTFAKELNLVRERGNKYFLTDLGEEYFMNLNQEGLIEILTDIQIDLLRKLISKDPFYSPTIFGIYSIVESAFLLSRNFYPIDLNELRKMFVIVSGKKLDWQADKSIQTATYTFLNFAIDLNLLGKIGKQIVITPDGFRFILMLQLHKSIEMIEGLSKTN